MGPVSRNRNLHTQRSHFNPLRYGTTLPTIRFPVKAANQLLPASIKRDYRPSAWIHRLNGSLQLARKQRFFRATTHCLQQICSECTVKARSPSRNTLPHPHSTRNCHSWSKCAPRRSMAAARGARLRAAFRSDWSRFRVEWPDTVPIHNLTLAIPICDIFPPCPEPCTSYSL